MTVKHSVNIRQLGKNSAIIPPHIPPPATPVACAPQLSFYWSNSLPVQFLGAFFTYEALPNGRRSIVITYFVAFCPLHVKICLILVAGMALRPNRNINFQTVWTKGKKVLLLHERGSHNSQIVEIVLSSKHGRIPLKFRYILHGIGFGLDLKRARRTEVPS